MDIFSLGSSCQTAYQIRRYTKNDTSYFFDWISSRKDSYKSIFLEEKNYFLEKNCYAVPKIEFDADLNKEINYGKVWVKDEYTQIHYQHEFPRLDGSYIIDDKLIKDHLPKAKEKFIYLKNKTISAIQNSSLPVLIRYENNITLHEAMSISADIHQSFLHLNDNIKVVIVSHSIEKNYIEDENTLILKVNKSEEWYGDHDSWNKVFNEIITRYNSAITFNDYNFWKKNIFTHNSIKSFITDVNNDGIHSLELAALPLDVLVQNSEKISKNNHILISFSPAVMRRNSNPPYFSLSGVAKESELPLISFADPTISMSKNLTLAWYSGNKYYPNLPQIIANICDEIIEKTGKKLIFVGGSGGGFSALNIQNLMQHRYQTQLIIWNPQTNLIAYSEDVVFHYMKTAFPDETTFLKKADLKNFVEKKIQNTITHTPDLQRLILMDGFDYRHIDNLKIFFGNASSHSNWKNNLIEIDQTTICFGDWGYNGNGHAQPPTKLLTSIIVDISRDKKYSQIDAITKQTNITNRKLLIIKNNLPNYATVRISGAFFDDYLMIETNLPNLFLAYDLSIRLVEKESRKVIYWGKRQQYTIKSKEIIKLDKIKINKLNMLQYDIHLSVKDFFNNEKILVRALNYSNTHIFESGKI